MKRRNAIVSFAFALVLSICSAGVAGAASAGVPGSQPIGADTSLSLPAEQAVTAKYTKYTLVDVERTHPWVDKSQQLAICTIGMGAGGGTCEVAGPLKVRSSIGTSFGVSARVVADRLGINPAGEALIHGTWVSSVLEEGSSYMVWAVGTRVTYRMQQWKGYKFLGQKKTSWRLHATSGPLVAFVPTSAVDAVTRSRAGSG